jgi:hypothetical protein
MAWTGQDSNSVIWWNTFDGNTWLGKQSTTFQTSTTPTLAWYGNKLYMAWKGFDLDKDNTIYLSVFDGTNWSAQQPLTGFQTSTSPALGYMTI